MSAFRMLALAAALAASLSAPAHAAPSDLAVTMTGPAQVEVEDRFHLDVAVGHDGKGKAGTTLTVTLPFELVVTGVSTTHGSCSFAHRTVDCTLDGIAGSKPARVTVGVYAAAGGTATTSATIADDADTSNNTATVTTVVDVPPAEPQTATAPYETDDTSGLGAADAATGAVGVHIASSCLSSGSPAGLCSGAASVGHGFVLTGYALREVHATVTLDVQLAEIDPAEPTAAAVAQVSLTLGGESVVCESDLVGIEAGVYARRDERLTLGCSWPTSVPSRNELRVEAGVTGYRTVVGTRVDVDAVVSSITITG